MPVFQELENLDRLFSTVSHPVIVNDLPNRTEEDRENFIKLISSTFTNDKISLLASCQCGELKSEFYASTKHRIGKICPSCKTPVKSRIHDDIGATLWFRHPDGVAKLINPIILIMLNKRFEKRDFRVIQWLMDRDYRPKGNNSDIPMHLAKYGIKRGYNFFVENFDFILEVLFQLPMFRVKKQSLGSIINMLIDDEDWLDTSKDRDILRELILRNRDKVFSAMIPIPDNALTILERNALGTYSDMSVMEGRDAFNTAFSIDRDFHDQRPEVKENRTAKILLKNAAYYLNIFSKHMSPKAGLFRKNAFGTRVNLSFRAVLTSNTDLKRSDDIELPWTSAIAVFRLHLMNKLMDHTREDCGFTHREAVEFLISYHRRYHPLLDKLFKEILSHGRGMPFLMLRNPTLKQGSKQVAWAIAVKPEPEDQSVSANDLSCFNNNGDFDGDELMFTMLPDKLMTTLSYPLSNFFSLLDLTAPFSLDSKTASMRDPDVATISNWIEKE